MSDEYRLSGNRSLLLLFETTDHVLEIFLTSLEYPSLVFSTVFLSPQNHTMSFREEVFGVLEVFRGRRGGGEHLSGEEESWKEGELKGETDTHDWKEGNEGNEREVRKGT